MLYYEKYVNKWIKLLFQILPLFDVVGCIKSAQKKRNLTLTIPWIVSYLSMIDQYSAHLETYQKVWRLLIIIYKELKLFKNHRNSFYLRLNLGWIFQLPNVPSDQFYLVLHEYNKKITEVNNYGKFEETHGLDSHDFIEETILYAVCPYLNEIYVILSENSSCNSVKHVRPVTTKENDHTKQLASKQLEVKNLLLVSNFYFRSNCLILLITFLLYYFLNMIFYFKLVLHILYSSKLLWLFSFKKIYIKVFTPFCTFFLF